MIDTSTGDTQWKYLDRKQPHSHDVRALATLQPSDSEPVLVSGGNDGQIILYSMPNFLKQHPSRQSKAPQRPILQLSQTVQPAVVMQVQQRQIQLWQLGRAADQQQPGSITGKATRLLPCWVKRAHSCAFFCPAMVEKTTVIESTACECAAHQVVSQLFLPICHP